VQLWTVGGAARIELETPNLLWWQFRLSSISVPNYYPTSGYVGCHRLPQRKKKN